MSAAPLSGCEVAHTKSKPCPVCETGTKGCSTRDDKQQFCRGKPVNPSLWKDLLGKPDSHGFHHYRRADDSTHLNVKPRNAPRPVMGSTSKKSPTEWRDKSVKLHKSRDLGKIATNFELPAEAFKCCPIIGLGYGKGIHPAEDDGEFIGGVTAPMFDGNLVEIGITKRLDREKDGKNKFHFAGATPGIMLGHQWDTLPGPLLNVEGMRDAAALALCSIPALARPSNVTGAEFLAGILKDYPAHESIVVMGENDKRFVEMEGCLKWPGKEGVTVVATKLATLLNRTRAGRTRVSVGTALIIALASHLQYNPRYQLHSAAQP